ncbi:MAG: heavy-metal-associated domain-containing protein [Anaerolineae bacterium]
MYADHHVQRVRQVLLALPGVDSVWASAAEMRVEVGYRAGETNASAIRQALEQAGYPEGQTLSMEDILSATRTAWQRSTIRFSQTHPADRQAAGDFRRY